MTSTRTAPPSTLARATGVAGELMLTAGVLVLLFVAWQVWWVTAEATAASQTTVQELARSFAAPPTGPPADPVRGGGTSLRTADVATGTPFGLVTVPRFGNGPQPVLQGTAIPQLDAGIGHEPTAAMPGQLGNFATAGHRDTYSHPYNLIDTLQTGDPVVVEVKDGWAIYRVVSKRIVPPTQIEVYAPTPDRPGVAPTQAWMTLIACEPHWTARSRWAVHALLETWVPRTTDRPRAQDHASVMAALAGQPTPAAPTTTVPTPTPPTATPATTSAPPVASTARTGG